MKTIRELTFNETTRLGGEDILYSSKIGQGVITVLDRMTGFGYRDIETGFKDNHGKFWLASCGFDIRKQPELTIDGAIKLIKERANTCTGE